MRTSHSHPIQVSWIFPASLYTLTFPYSYIYYLNGSCGNQALPLTSDSNQAMDSTSPTHPLHPSSFPDSTSPDLLDLVNLYPLDEDYEKINTSLPSIITSTTTTNTTTTTTTSSSSELIQENSSSSMLFSTTTLTPTQPAMGSPLFPNGYGNICLSSCPGKKVRLNVPFGGRSSVRRELNVDLPRLAKMGVTTIVNCLDNEELEYIGAPWNEYISEATAIHMDVIRLPIVEGEAPKDLSLLSEVLSGIHQKLMNGQNVLIHCRGGIGRAALVACAYLLQHQFIRTAKRSIEYLRKRRSPRAIETIVQEEFLEMFFKLLREREKERSNTQKVNSE